MPPITCSTKSIKYLSHYISGTAISNYRILSDDGEYVTIRVKSYRKKCHEALRMTGEEFVKRLLCVGLPTPHLSGPQVSSWYHATFRWHACLA